MKNDKMIVFLANPNSPHVRHWLALMKNKNITPSLFTISKYRNLDAKYVTCYVLPFFFRGIPKMFQYCCLGGILRLRKLIGKDTKVKLHAHNASGYGLSAYLSGAQYVITTYGTEVYSYKKNKVYAFMIKKILLKAKSITTSSEQMTSFLLDNFEIKRSKIRELSLGVADIFYCKQGLTDKPMKNLKSNPVWVINRRIHPLYNTIQVIEAFKLFFKSNQVGALIVLAGDSDKNYLSEVRLLVDEIDEIELIEGFLSQREVSKILQSAHFCISVPKSDQMSSSILEGCASGAIPLLAKHKAYQLVSSYSYQFNIKSFNDSACFLQIFQDSYSLYKTEQYHVFRQEMLKKAKEFKFSRIEGEFLSFYNSLFDLT